MSAVESVAAMPFCTESVTAAWVEPALGLFLGILGGVADSLILHGPVSHAVLQGGIFGLAFGLLFARRATSAGAGLIWGLAAAFLMWLTIPAGILPLIEGRSHAMGTLTDASNQFPTLVAYLVCFGMPVGTLLGIRRGLGSTKTDSDFHWGRAIIAGGLAGLLGGSIFDRWMSAGDYFPLLSGLNQVQSRTMSLTLQFLIAVGMGVLFGVLFQRDVRGYGSSMGWGIGYAILWWFLGPLTLWPLLSHSPVDWSAEAGSAIFGSLVGHIRELKRRRNNAKIVFLTVHEDSEILASCLAAGGLGYVVKELMDSDLIPAINEALAGREFVSQFSSESETP